MLPISISSITLVFDSHYSSLENGFLIYQLGINFIIYSIIILLNLLSYKKDVKFTLLSIGLQILSVLRIIILFTDQQYNNLNQYILIILSILILANYLSYFVFTIYNFYKYLRSLRPITNLQK